MIDGFCKDEVMQKLLQHFIGITKEQMPEDAAEMSRQLVPYGAVSYTHLHALRAFYWHE